MKKVITYGSYDMLHRGHIRLLERAKELGDYLIVGVTSDDYDKTRGKINLQQTLMERVEGVKSTGIPDEVIIEEYEGQKIDDIKKYHIDIFTVGSDWEGYFDYLKEYCEVVYLERTKGVSSSEIRAEKATLKLGVVGIADTLEKFVDEAKHVNGMNVVSICTNGMGELKDKLEQVPLITEDYDYMLENVDAVYIHSYPDARYEEIKKALYSDKHVLCESPVALKKEQTKELIELAKNRGVVLMEAIKTAYSTAFHRMLLLLDTGIIGQVVSVDATCTNLKPIAKEGLNEFNEKWNSLSTWGPTAMLPVFQILGTKYRSKTITSKVVAEEGKKNDSFTKVDFVYDGAVASVKVGRGVKSEGTLIVSGTKGYVYVPAPWWKTDYFEVRYEDLANNKKFFYQLDGEGIRHEVAAFSRAIQGMKTYSGIEPEITLAISEVMEDFENNKDCISI